MSERKSVASLADIGGEADRDNWNLDWRPTSKGVKDFKSGLTWSRDQGNLMGQFQAQTHCAKKGMRLPEKKELIEVSKRGFYNATKYWMSLREATFYWSSTIDQYGMFFNMSVYTGPGGFHEGWSPVNYPNAVLCVL